MMYWPSYPYQVNGRHYYMGRLIGEVTPYSPAHHFTHITRQNQEYPDFMLAALQIQPGMAVADIGAGIGLNSLRLARLVGPYGRVFSSDIQSDMLYQLNYNAAMSGLSSIIIPILASQSDANLPANSCDLILMVDTYHECQYPPAILDGLRRALKSNGRLVLVEYRLEDSWMPNMYNDHRMSINQAKVELESNGFQLSQVLECLPWQHILIFNKISS
jgi:ubiquinone/menaquinone biosynthesis C-methylase UbiE